MARVENAEALWSGRGCRIVGQGGQEAEIYDKQQQAGAARYLGHFHLGRLRKGVPWERFEIGNGRSEDYWRKWIPMAGNTGESGGVLQRLKRKGCKHQRKEE